MKKSNKIDSNNGKQLFELLGELDENMVEDAWLEHGEEVIIMEQKSPFRFVKIAAGIAAAVAIVGGGIYGFNRYKNSLGYSSAAGISDDEVSDVSKPEISTPEISEGVPDQRLTDEQLEMISGLKKQSFVGPDGETVQAADAADVEIGSPFGRVYDDEFMTDENGSIVLDEDGIPKYKDDEWIDTLLKYDFAYIDYVKPYCNFVIENDVIGADYSEALKWQEELETMQTEREWRKVKAGDTLENGLTVIKAECEVLPTQKTDYYSMKLHLGGEFSIEGILTFREKDDKLLSEGETIFNPDSVNTAGVPLIFNGSTTDNGGYYTIRTLTGGYIACDGQGMRLGMLNDLNIDRDEIFGDKNCAHVKITFKDPEFHTDNRTDQMQAAFIELGGEIVNIEPLS